MSLKEKLEVLKCDFQGVEGSAFAMAQVAPQLIRQLIDILDDVVAIADSINNEK